MSGSVMWGEDLIAPVEVRKEPEGEEDDKFDGGNFEQWLVLAEIVL